MATAAEIVFRLTETTLAAPQRVENLYAFAEAAGWHPSDELAEYPGTEFANGHLLVEHGMANTAVISFLKPENRFEELGRGNQLRLLQLSYNNLVDWHLLPDRRGLTVVYNRADPPQLFRYDDTEKWRGDAFEFVVDQPVRPEVKALDDAVVSTVSLWRRAIAGEIGTAVDNSDLAELFNLIFFIRALEDHKSQQGMTFNRLLVKLACTLDNPTIAMVCERAINTLGKKAFPKFVAETMRKLSKFDGLAFDTVRQLFLDFYANRFSPYAYDFALISKHAMSRIYEHYVSLLRSPDDTQPSLFPKLATEVTNRSLGAYYTPQFIARFFSRFIQQNTTPRTFRETKAIDPACGSGIFLRTLQELRCDRSNFAVDSTSIKGSFANLVGTDVDGTACEAARLSLSLLHLVLTDEFPKHLRIERNDAMTVARSGADKGTFGAVLSNPPYIRWERQTAEQRLQVVEYLGSQASGKSDAYLAVLKAGIDLLKPGGFGCFVLPHAFLQADNSKGMREYLVEHCTLRVVADLSDLNVFKDVGTYTILVIVQRRDAMSSSAPVCVVQCRGSVGYALSAALQGRQIQNEHFRVFELEHDAFSAEPWRLMVPELHRFTKRLDSLAKLSDFAEVFQGIVTGADDVFIIDKHDVPANDKLLWKPLLADREMLAFEPPNSAGRMVFYPFDGKKWLSRDEVRKDFPETWKWIDNHKKRLSERGSLRTKKDSWWMPIWPRDPNKLFQPKIVCPHLMATPRFALDRTGKFAVTRSPFIVAKDESGLSQRETLLYLLAFLNSSVGFWQLSTLSHKYDRQYVMVEGKSLRSFRVPHPATLERSELRKVLELVGRVVADGDQQAVGALDGLICAILGIDRHQRRALGLVS